jgi:uncharacterized DUF497 family protein
MDFEFEWDEEKDQENIRDHGLSLADGIEVFYDPFRMVRWDNDSSAHEERWQTIGRSDGILFVVYTERGKNSYYISPHCEAF